MRPSVQQKRLQLLKPLKKRLLQMPSVQQKRLQQKKPLKTLPLKLPTMPKLLKTLHLQKMLPMPKLQILTRC